MFYSTITTEEMQKERKNIEILAPINTYGSVFLETALRPKNILMKNP